MEKPPGIRRLTIFSCVQPAAYSLLTFALSLFLSLALSLFLSLALSLALSLFLSLALFFGAGLFGGFFRLSSLPLVEAPQPLLFLLLLAAQFLFSLFAPVSARSLRQSDPPSFNELLLRSSKISVSFPFPSANPPMDGSAKCIGNSSKQQKNYTTK
jgi:hypothetical protein